MPIKIERARQPERKEEQERVQETVERETELARVGGVSIASKDHPERNEDALTIDVAQELAVVADGVGGERAGDVASRIVTKELPEALAKAYADVQALQGREQQILRDEVNEMIRGNVPFLEEDRRDPLFAERFKQLLKDKQSYFKELKAPREVQDMSVAMMRALKKVHGTIRETAQKNPDQKGMASTAVAVKLMRHQDGRTFAVLGSVGDSMIRIRRNDGNIETPLPSDSYMEYAVAAGKMTGAEFEPKKLVPGTPLWDARFRIVMQALGGSREPIPHVTVVEVRSGDKLLLASDGVEDNDLDADYERTLGEDAAPAALAARMRERAELGIEKKEGKGWDDITAVVMEIKPTEEVIELGEEELEPLTAESVNEQTVADVLAIHDVPEFYRALEELNIAELRALKERLEGESGALPETKGMKKRVRFAPEETRLNLVIEKIEEGELAA